MLCILYHNKKNTRNGSQREHRGLPHVITQHKGIMNIPIRKVTGWKGYIMQTLLIKDGAAVLILYKIDFKTRNITRKKTDIS